MTSEGRRRVAEEGLTVITTKNLDVLQTYVGQEVVCVDGPLPWGAVCVVTRVYRHPDVPDEPDTFFDVNSNGRDIAGWWTHRFATRNGGVDWRLVEGGGQP